MGPNTYIGEKNFGVKTEFSEAFGTGLFGH
jgi:hypothetical protein